MKEALYFYLTRCPHCIKANAVLEEVKKDPKYAGVKLTLVEESENEELAGKFDYNYVPTFFVDGKKFFEAQPGKPFTADDCKALFNSILS